MKEREALKLELKSLRSEATEAQKEMEDAKSQLQEESAARESAEKIVAELK